MNDYKSKNGCLQTIEEIDKLSPEGILEEILKHYTCPSECNGSCCRQFDIFYSSNDVQRISNANKKHKKILKNLVINKTPKVIHGHAAPKSWIYPSKPCPFLKDSGCAIQKIKPECCKYFPFGVKEDFDPTHPAYPIMITLDRCYLGTDILMDFMFYHMVLSKVETRIKFDFGLYKYIFLNEIMWDKTQVKRLYASQFYDFEQFKCFLLFLNTTEIELDKVREEFKHDLLNEKLKTLKK